MAWIYIHPLKSCADGTTVLEKLKPKPYIDSYLGGLPHAYNANIYIGNALKRVNLWLVNNQILSMVPKTKTVADWR